MYYRVWKWSQYISLWVDIFSIWSFFSNTGICSFGCFSVSGRRYVYTWSYLTVHAQMGILPPLTHPLLLPSYPLDCHQTGPEECQGNTSHIQGLWYVLCVGGGGGGVWVCGCVGVGVWVCVFVCVYLWMCVCICMYVCACVCVFVCVYNCCEHVCVYLCVCICVCVCVCLWYVFVVCVCVLHNTCTTDLDSVVSRSVL